MANDQNDVVKFSHFAPIVFFTHQNALQKPLLKKARTVPGRFADKNLKVPKKTILKNFKVTRYLPDRPFILIVP